MLAAQLVLLVIYGTILAFQIIIYRLQRRINCQLSLLLRGGRVVSITAPHERRIANMNKKLEEAGWFPAKTGEPEELSDYDPDNMVWSKGGPRPIKTKTGILWVWNKDGGE